MYTLTETATFSKWLKGLTDRQAKMRIVARMLALQAGHFGDAKSLGDGVNELRIHVGAGYRVYYAINGEQIILLLCGGNKSTQDADIKRAKQIIKI